MKPLSCRLLLILSCTTALLLGFTEKPGVQAFSVQNKLTPIKRASIPLNLLSSWSNSVGKLAAASDIDENESSNDTTTNRLDRILSQLTLGFPFYVLMGALLGLKKPQLLSWANQGNLISLMLACVMCGTGLTLRANDFVKVLKENWSSVPLGVACQFLIMPFMAFVIGSGLLLTFPDATVASNLFLGLVLVGCSPGGTASNLVALIAQADVALSVILTSCSTFLAVVVTPLLVQLLVQSQAQVSGWELCKSTANIVLGPVLLGMFLNSKAPRLSRWISRFTPLASALLVGVICGAVVAKNSLLLTTSGNLWKRVVASVFLLHAGGFGLGYLVPRCLFNKTQETSRTMSIEVGMQNSALAIVLAQSIGAPAIAGLPAALSATAHSCMGSLMAAVWRLQGKNHSQEE